VIEDGVDILAELRGFADVHGVLRNRRDELQLSCERIDDLSGVSSGFEAGAKARDPRNAIVRLPALGLRLLVATDPTATARMERRWEKRQEHLVRAGKRRPRKMSKAERSELARRGGYARAAALSVKTHSTLNIGEISREHSAAAARSSDNWAPGRVGDVGGGGTTGGECARGMKTSCGCKFSFYVDSGNCPKM
jgi:hypothetical protein